ncbi:MAG: T9SS type A sorting domain-containing protein, partial [Saprospiraceae bacterium]|nr:T9SS type A sorting domain-containing protein [Saprospiraceae bacterium]
YTVAPNTTILLQNLLNGAPTDNCGIAGTGLSKDRFTCAETGTQNVTITTVDVNGNTASCVVPVLVEDGFQFVCNDKNLTLDASGIAILTTADVVTLMPSACGSYFPSLSQNFFDCTDVGTNPVTVNISNGESCQVTVTVTDAMLPSVTCQNINMSLDANGDATLLPAQVLSDATDACGIGNLSLSRSNFSCTDLGNPVLITLTATDVNGNSATCTATVTVTDPISPTLNCQDVTLQLNSLGQATLTPAMVSPMISDNCAVLSTNLSQTAFECSSIVEPPTNYALNFTGGPNAYLAFASALTGLGNFTFETWFKDETSGTTPRYLVSWQGSVLELADLNGNLFVRFGSSSTVISAPLRNGAWHHLAVVRNGTNVTIYLNGGAIWSGAYNFALGSNFQIGRRYSTTATTQGPWIGKVDEVRFWNTARTALQIQSAMNAPLQGTPSGLIGYWPMNDGPGLAIAADASVNNNHGVLSGIMNPSTAWVSGAPLQPLSTVVPVTLTALDIAGNSSTCTVSITILSGPNPCCPPPVVHCRNISVPLGPSGTVTITPAQVDNGSSADCGIQSMSVSPNTFTCATVGVQTVTLTITDNNGVSATCTAQVTVLGKPDIQTSSTPVVCEGEAFDLTTLNIAENTGASFVLTYHSDTPANAGNELASTNVSPAATTTFYVLATSSSTGCTDELPVVVTVNPTPSDLDIYLYDTPEICTGENYSLCGIGIVSGGTGLSNYSWHSDEPATPGNLISDCDVSPTTNQTYYALLTDGNGCTVTRSFDLTVNTGPDVSVSTLAPICAGESLNLAALTVTDANNTGASLTYHSNSPANTGNQLPSTTVMPAASTTYYLLATASNGCKDEVSVSVVVNASVPQAFCRNVTVQLGSDGTYTLSPEQVDDGSFATCGSVTLSVTPNVFTCDELGDNTVTLTATAPGGASNNCTAVVHVEAVGDRLFGTGTEPQMGVVFSMRTDGSEFNALTTFERSSKSPHASLVSGEDGFLYGTSVEGGSLGRGTIFRVQPDGSGFQILHHFDGINGENPYAGLTLGDDGLLYGTTRSGGSDDFYGVIFRIQRDGNGFQVLHDFSYLDGWYPYTRLSFGSDGLLYGTASGGGSLGKGTVYRLQPDGTGFEVLHQFNGADGAYPYAGLTLGVDGFLYGTTTSGGNLERGTIYRLQSDGTGFEVLNQFNDVNAASSYSELTFGADGRLYGTTSFGGGRGYGTIYRLQPDGTDFQLIYSFSGSDGGYPFAGLIPDANGFLYGTTYYGGTSGFWGTVFRIQTNGTGFQTLQSFNADNGFYPYAGLILYSDGLLYGTTSGGGNSGNGVIYRLQPEGFGFQAINDLVNASGAQPLSELVLGSDELLYGVARFGGNSGNGVVFRIQKNGAGFQVIHSFDNAIGAEPDAGLTPGPDEFLYGTTAFGGNMDFGTIYRMKMDGTNYEVLHSFDYSNGVHPYAKLVSGDDEFLYGTTHFGGTLGNGTVFRIQKDGTGFQLLYSYEMGGTNPFGGLTLGADGFLYGTTSEGGDFDMGIVYRLNVNGTNFEILHHFDGVNGTMPFAGLTLGNDGLLYGTTELGGNYNSGTLFRIQTNGMGFQVLHHFDYTNGGQPRSGLTLGGDGYLYGTTFYGGYGTTFFGSNSDHGIVYRILQDGTAFEVIRYFDGSDASKAQANLLYVPGYDCSGGYAAPKPGLRTAEAETPSKQIDFYPNPTAGKLFIRMRTDPESLVNIQVFNNLGQQVLAQQMEATAGSVGVLELGRLDNGVYIVRVSVPGQAPVSERVVLNRP